MFRLYRHLQATHGAVGSNPASGMDVCKGIADTVSCESISPVWYVGKNQLFLMLDSSGLYMIKNCIKNLKGLYQKLKIRTPTFV